MDFTLGNTEPVNNTTSVIDTEKFEEAIASLQSQLDVISESLRNLSVDYNGFKSSSTNSVTSINSAIDRMQGDIRNNKTSIDSLSNSVTTDKLNATEASISNAHILSLKADSLIDLPDIEPTSIKTANGEIDTITATTITADNATIQNETVNSLKVKEILTVPEFNAQKLTSSNLTTDNANIQEASIDKISIGGVPVEYKDVKYSGWTNGYLHKIDVKANGILIFKLNNSSVVLTPGNISSNYDKLYAAYESEDGYWHIYFDTDLECQLLVIGTSDFSIVDSLVLKSSVRRNADSSGQPNNSNSVKVVVATQLPRIGQRNVIYVVLGDCAYYCDGQYFYEMASKKRN